MSFPLEIADMALSLYGRRCSICHKFAGNKIELHHISQREKGGKDSLENCIPLCFDCQLVAITRSARKAVKFRPRNSRNTGMPGLRR